MLPQKQRFLRDQFPGGRSETRFNFFWGAVSLYDGTPRVAVVISKKVLKKAHDRNRTRRRIFGALVDTPLSKGVVVHPRREALTMPFGRIKKDLQDIL